MKKNALITMLIVFGLSAIANNAFAQGPYFSFNAGYAFGTSRQHIEGFYKTTIDGSLQKNKQVFVSLGKGINLGGTFGYMFTKNIGAEMGLSYLSGSKTKATTSDPDNNYSDNQTIKLNMIKLTPSLVISAGLEKLNPYAKFGLIIGAGSLKGEYNENDDGDKSELNVKFNGGLAIGFNAGVGVLYSLSNTLSLFSEVNLVSLSYAPTKGETTKAIYNGDDVLSDLPTIAKEYEFVDSISSDDNEDDDKPQKQLKEKYALGSVGINVGLRISF